jgi:hypothetical protein
VITLQPFSAVSVYGAAGQGQEAGARYSSGFVILIVETLGAVLGLFAAAIVVLLNEEIRHQHIDNRELRHF